jgi:hypothetical protein
MLDILQNVLLTVLLGPPVQLRLVVGAMLLLQYHTLKGQL